MSDEPILKQAQDKLKPFEPKLLDAFSRVFARKRPPQSMRALAPLAMVFLLEAFGLAFLLDRATVQLAIRAARGPGKGEDDEPQTSILDAVGQDFFLGAFVAVVSLRAELPPLVECLGHKLDLSSCKTIDEATSFAASQGWIVYHDTRGATPGLRLIPRTDGVQTRLRAPLANIVAMYAPDKRDEQIAQLEAKIAEHEEMRRALDQQWQAATGASDPEMAAELTAQRVEQIAKLEKQLSASTDAARMALAAVVQDRAVVTTYPDGHTEIVVDESDAQPATLEVSQPKEATVPRMVWPDPKRAPSEIACANAIASHRRGEFVELAFPKSPRILENVRAWLAYHDFIVRDPSPDATGYATCAIGTGDKTPPKWADMKQRERDSYPGFVLFAPDGSAKVVFCAKGPTSKPGKPRSKKVKS